MRLNGLNQMCTCKQVIGDSLFTMNYLEHEYLSRIKKWKLMVRIQHQDICLRAYHNVTVIISSHIAKAIWNIHAALNTASPGYG